MQWVYDGVDIAAQQIRNEGDAAEVLILGPRDDQELKDYTQKHSMPAAFPDCDENDLLSRYLFVSEEFTHIVRITADCWCIHPEIITQVTKMLDDKTHYASNTIFRTFQEGQDVQAFSRKALLWLNKNSDAKSREHIWSDFDLNDSIRQLFRKEVGEVSQLMNRDNPATAKTSIDTKEDLELARRNFAKWESSQKKILS